VKQTRTVPNRSTVLRDLLSGQYKNPISITAFNLAEGWVRDVSEDVAREVVDGARLELARLPEPTQKFVERQLGEVPAWPVF
jgi:hypothetical protein